jgi:hypothetical protein
MPPVVEPLLLSPPLLLSVPTVVLLAVVAVVSVVLADVDIVTPDDALVEGPLVDPEPLVSAASSLSSSPHAEVISAQANAARDRRVVMHPQRDPPVVSLQPISTATRASRSPCGVRSRHEHTRTITDQVADHG